MKHLKNIEQKFFEAFDIPADTSETAYFTGCLNEYPKLTDSILLQLLCIYNTNVILEEQFAPQHYQAFRENLLYWLILDRNTNNMYKQVRKLFGVKDE